MPGARLPHFERVGVEEGPADERLQSSAALHPNLRGSGVATLDRIFAHSVDGALPKQSPEGGETTYQIHSSLNTLTRGWHLQHHNCVQEHDGVGLREGAPAAQSSHEAAAWTLGLANSGQRRSTPRRFHGRPTVGLATPTSSTLTPIN